MTMGLVVWKVGEFFNCYNIVILFIQILIGIFYYCIVSYVLKLKVFFMLCKKIRQIL